MKLQLSFAAAILQLASVGLTSLVPLNHFQLIANSPHVDEATRAAANFTYHHTIRIQAAREAAYGNGETFAPYLDDGPFDDEQNTANAARLAAERDALADAAMHQGVDPTATEGGDGPPERVRRHAGRMEKRQFPYPYTGVWEDDGTCYTAPPAHKVRENGSPIALDPDANTLFDGQYYTLNLFSTLYERNSINGTGGNVYGTIHFCQNYNNCIWDGEQAIFGDADGYAYVKNSFVNSLSLIGHEYTHGVIQFTNPLYYYGQSGALNEHLADVFGVLTEQYHLFQSTDEASWLVGAGTVVGGIASRSFIAPGTAYNTPVLGPDLQAANMSTYFYGSADNYGVHFNSGIPNHAFYLFAKAVGGYAYRTPGTIWYAVLSGRFGKFDYVHENFQTFAQKTISAAFYLYGFDEAQMLREAWEAVQVL